MSSTNPAGRIISEETLLTEARFLVGVLRRAGHEAYFVGGCVRDQLLGVPLKDIDIATSARPEQVGALFSHVRFVGARFGVALVRHGGIDFEIATFRRDGKYVDHRHPETVDYGTLEEDARRRDFTVNAMFLDPIDGKILDPEGGRADLERRVLRAVGNPEQRFNEDALRMLRAVRFATRLNFEIQTDTFQAIRGLAHTIEFVSPERQRDELTGIFTGPRPGEGLRLLDELRLLSWLLPEVVAMKGVEQGAYWHPEGDVFVHTCHVLDNAEPRSTVNAWAALLHDVGKPPTFRRDDVGNITFYDHQYVGADIAEEILTRYRFPNEEVGAICDVIRRHMTFKDVEQMRPSTLRRFLGAPTISHDLALHRADCLGSSGRLDYYEFCLGKLREFQGRDEPVVPPPLLSGNDVLALGYAPGPIIGRILKAVQEQQLEGNLVSRDEALSWIRREEHDWTD